MYSIKFSKITITEENLVKELKNKNNDAMEFLIHNYGRLYKSVVLKYIHDTAYVEECLNDVFMSIWNNVDKFSSKSTFTNWSCAVARYKSIDLLRKIKKENEKIVALDEDIEIAIKDKYDIDDDMDDEIRKAFSELNEEDRIIFTKLYVNGESSEEVATSLNLKMSNLYNKVSRAKRKLRLVVGGSHERHL